MCLDISIYILDHEWKNIGYMPQIAGILIGISFGCCMLKQCDFNAFVRVGITVFAIFFVSMCICNFPGFGLIEDEWCIQFYIKFCKLKKRS